MRILMHALVCLLLASSVFAAEKVQGVWEVLDHCRLSPDQTNDGDSFRVQHGTETLAFRLYYVDAPEADDASPERLRAQARYFSIPEAEVLAAGQRASRLTQQFLRGEFTVITKWEDARGEADARYFAMVKKENRYLSMNLVQNGRARIYGLPTSDRWPSGEAPLAYLSRLKQSEREAQATQTGIWAIAGNSPQMAGLASLGQAAPSASPEAGIAHALSPLPAPSQTRSVNINTAPAAALETLPGIGPALAERIIAARPIETIESLTHLPGISANKLAGFQDLITLYEPPPPPKTVDFYLADLDTYRNTDVTVVVASLAQSAVNCPENFRAVHLETAFEGKSGGGITALIPDEFYDAFIQFYSKPRREFTGRLYPLDDAYVLIYRRK